MQHIMCILRHHRILGIPVGRIFVVQRHLVETMLVETMQLRLHLMALTHLVHEELPFTQNALLVFRSDGGKEMPLVDGCKGVATRRAINSSSSNRV